MFLIIINIKVAIRIRGKFINFENLKKIFLLTFFCCAFNSCALISDLPAQRKDVSDYFSIGLFGGTYVGQFPLYGENDFVNSVAIEAEYFKFSDLSFYMQGLYEFTGSDLRKLYHISYGFPLSITQKPETYRLNVSFGGRYYLRTKDVNPFFQFGINQEVNYIGKYSYQIDRIDYIAYYFNEGYYFYNLSANLGVGLNIRVSEKFSLELKYDLYKSILKDQNDYTGYSVLGGIKYHL